MDFFDKLDSSKGGFIFLSHSHEDIKKVREIRNSLEERGFEPLCFYLKCLDDDSEIEDLIKREIDAREWFVFVNSENSRKSKWVTLEREYITKNNSKKIITVNIDDEKDVLKAVNKLTSNLRVYLAYSHKDIELAKKIKDAGLTLMSYSGYTLEELEARHDAATDELLGMLDMLVDGRYDESLRNLTLVYCGSENQRVIDMNKTRKARAGGDEYSECDAFRFARREDGANAAFQCY